MNKCQQCGIETRNRVFCSYVCRGNNTKKDGLTDRAIVFKSLLEEGLTLKDIGTMYDLTRERVRQVIKKAFNIETRFIPKKRYVKISGYECVNCHKTFYVRFDSSPKYTCSQKCYGVLRHNFTQDKNSQRMAVPSRKYPTKKYKMVYVGIKNGTSIYRTEHRIIMETKLGRKLKTNEHVHHKDGNGLNNDPSNLEVMKAGKHLRMHSTNWNPYEYKFVGHKFVLKDEFDKWTKVGKIDLLQNM